MNGSGAECMLRYSIGCVLAGYRSTLCKTCIDARWSRGEAGLDAERTRRRISVIGRRERLIVVRRATRRKNGNDRCSRLPRRASAGQRSSDTQHCTTLHRSAFPEDVFRIGGRTYLAATQVP